MSVARVALGTVDVHLPGVDSLKGKRHILKSLKDKVRVRFEVAEPLADGTIHELRITTRGEP